MTKHLLQHQAQSKERKDALGEVFTPLPLVDEILEKLPSDVWRPNKTYLDPSCGNGNFLVRVVAWKIWKGSSIEEALSTTYGVDIMEDNIKHARQRVLINTFVADLFGRKRLLNHLSHQDESQFELLEEYDEFLIKYYPIVQKNIVCHDALTYDYNVN